MYMLVALLALLAFLGGVGGKSAKNVECAKEDRILHNANLPNESTPNYRKLE